MTDAKHTLPGSGGTYTRDADGRLIRAAAAAAKDASTAVSPAVETPKKETKK